MTKGTRAPSTKRDSNPAPRAASKAKGGVGKASESPKTQRWRFPLVNLTPAATNVNQGADVDGIPQGSTVMVISSVGALGYAPAMIARQMIAAVQRTGGTLKGFVISVGNSQKTVEVELTLS